MKHDQVGVANFWKLSWWYKDLKLTQHCHKLEARGRYIQSTVFQLWLNFFWHTFSSFSRHRKTQERFLDFHNVIFYRSECNNWIHWVHFVFDQRCCQKIVTCNHFFPHTFTQKWDTFCIRFDNQEGTVFGLLPDSSSFNAILFQHWILFRQ